MIPKRTEQCLPDFFSFVLRCPTMGYTGIPQLSSIIPNLWNLGAEDEDNDALNSSLFP